MKISARMNATNDESQPTTTPTKKPVKGDSCMAKTNTRKTSPSSVCFDDPAFGGFKGMTGDFKTWMQRSRDLKKKGIPMLAEFCQRKAYFDANSLGDSFYAYVRDIIMQRYGKSSLFDRYAHRLECYFIAEQCKPTILKEVSKRVTFEYSHGSPRFRMLQAARGSFKSTVGTLGYATWRIARDYLLHGESRLRILLASENTVIAKRNMRFCRQMMDWSEKFILLGGDHKGERRERQQWAIEGLTSQFRMDPSLGEATLAPIGVDAERTGFHYNLVIPDDLQAYNFSGSAEQIDRCHDFYKLLHSILVQDGTGEMLILGTRWHNDDIYRRLEELAKKIRVIDRLKVLKIPAMDEKTKSINFPTIYSVRELERIKNEQGSRIFANQYMLTAISAEDVRLKHEYIQYWTPQMIEGRRMNRYITVDLAFTEIDKTYTAYRAKKIAYTVILTIDVDEDFNYFIKDWFRERVSKLTAIKEMYRQYTQHKGTQAVLMQRFDRVQIGETLDQYARLVRQYLPIEWISYPSAQNKINRIDVSVVPQFEALRIFLRPDMGWFLSGEFYDYPQSDYFDCLDALCNITYYSNPATKRQHKQKKTEHQIRHDRLKAGKGLANRNQGESWKRIV